MFLKPNRYSYSVFIKLGNLRYIYRQVFLLFCSDLIVKRLVVVGTRRRILFFEEGDYFCYFQYNWKSSCREGKVIIKDTGLLSSFLNNFTNLLRTMNGPEALFLFKSLIVFRISSSFVDV